MCPSRLLHCSVAAAMLLAVTACGGDDKPEATKPSSSFPSPAFATIQGRLLAVGGPAPGDPRPMRRGTITLVGTDGSRIDGAVDAKGHYAVGVTPGSYRVVAHSEDYLAGKEPCRPEKQPVELIEGKTTTVDLFCSMR